MKLGTLMMAAAVAAAGLARRRRLSTPMRVVLTIVVAGLVVAGSGLVQFPSVEAMVREATTVLGEFTYVVVGASAFAESGAFVGLVAPGELIVILGGVTAGHGTIALPMLVGVVWACAFGGDLLAYALGRRHGRGLLLRHGAAFGVTDARLARVEGFLADHGAKTILVGRFIGVVRALAPFVAGASQMRARTFVPVALLASGLWSVTFCSLGYAFWESLDTLLILVERGSLALAVIAMLVMAGVWIRRRAAGAPARQVSR